MPSFYKSAAALAMAGAAFANPMKRDDSCLAAVTGKAALGDDSLRKEHCSSFIKTIVTPSAVTVTETITDAPEPSSTGWEQWKRDVTVCPNEVPNYASACDESGYKSACSAYGIVGETTITIPATTTTKTVYIGKGGAGATGKCTGATATETSTITKTETKTAATATVTVTVGGNGPTGTGSSPPFPAGTGSPAKCLDDAKATEFADAFKTLLEYTSYNGTQGAPGRGYKSDVSAKYLAEDFVDYSDSINWMAGFPLGSVTFGSRAAFDYGQGLLQPELTVETQFVHHSCNQITWKWIATTQSYAKVMGINHMILSDDLTQIKENHAEFDNAAWLSSFGLQCKVPTS